MKSKDIVDVFYRECFYKEHEGFFLKVFKPIDMKPLPIGAFEYLLGTLDTFISCDDIAGSDDGWFSSNYDAGYFDMVYLTHSIPHQGVVVYVSAIVVRPFSEEAEQIYEKAYSLCNNPRDILSLRFDSREYDIIRIADKYQTKQL